MFSNELVMFDVCVGETDLQIGCTGDLVSEALSAVRKARSIIFHYIKRHPKFESTLKPISKDESAPNLIKEMIASGQAAGTGPMASVAGVISQYVGETLLEKSGQVFVENGGDIYISSDCDRTIGIFAGDSPLSDKIGIKIAGSKFPLGICTSSGTVGHSLSFGNADAVTVISKNTGLADAVATATANRIRKQSDIEAALEFAMGIDGILGIITIMGDKMGALGDIELAKVSNQG